MHLAVDEHPELPQIGPELSQINSTGFSGFSESVDPKQAGRTSATRTSSARVIVRALCTRLDSCQATSIFCLQMVALGVRLAPMARSKDAVPLYVRIPVDLSRRIRAQLEKEKRTMTAWLVRAIENELKKGARP